MKPELMMSIMFGVLLGVPILILLFYIIRSYILTNIQKALNSYSSNITDKGAERE
jgi:F0F1-type ATP synthase membrane subunit b/b'